MATADTRIPSATANNTQGLVSLEQAKLGVLLSEQGLLDPIQLLYARQKNLVEQQTFGRLLIQHGLANESDIVRTHAEMQGIAFTQVETLPVADPQVLAMFNRELCQLRQFLPLRRVDDVLEVVLGDADPAAVGQAVLQRCGLRCRFLQGEDRDQPALQAIREAVKNNQPCRQIIRNYRKDGTPFWNELSCSNGRSAGLRPTTITPTAPRNFWTICCTWRSASALPISTSHPPRRACTCCSASMVCCARCSPCRCP